ncbi:hypothetical protein N4G70_33555 [Streptomyces sp. ASQP_92]|uniref:hypothetical protein n=1 Tax=Streptomyces sp. ASQP_92 TaxID=2979116 RepID=UPI0021C1FEED|nr:hypothetical protein [Streptomyces sp. ASQP_92]MCT9093759.1 hypothetical protein [Streptomyces sp. ASQP_92]
MVAGLLGALVVFGGFAVPWDGDIDRCEGKVMQEGDTCRNLQTGESYDYDDIEGRVDDHRQKMQLGALGIGSVLLIGAAVAAASASREVTRVRTGAARTCPEPDDVGPQELHVPLQSRTSVTLHAHALKYVDKNKAVHWVQWDQITQLSSRVFTDGKWNGFVILELRITGRRDPLTISGRPADPAFLDAITTAAVRAKVQDVLDTLDRTGEYALEHSRNLRLTDRGFLRTKDGTTTELPWSALTAFEKAPVDTIHLKRGNENWDLIGGTTAVRGHGGTLSIANTAALQVAQRLWNNSRTP